MLSLNDYLIQFFLLNTCKQLELADDNIFLDLGCGTQPYKNIYDQYVKHAISTDIACQNPKTPPTVISDSQFLPFSDNSFDTILFSEVIEHVPDYTLALNEISRVLSPGGYLIITWPFNYSMHELPFDFLRITEFGMQKVLEENNMQIISFFRRGNKITLIHCLIGTFLTNMNEYFRRITILGKVTYPLLQFADKLIEYTYLLSAKKTISNRFYHPREPGLNLDGAKGSLSLWTLGYCALVRKDD